VLPPYTFPTPVVRCVIDALQEHRLAQSAAVVGNIIDERKRMRAELKKRSAVRRVWPSSANFLLVEFADLPATGRFLEERHILIRDFSSYPELRNCARVTIGTAEENDALLRVLDEFGGRPSE
jgi:histidinol-phosphate aminotransferase